MYLEPRRQDIKLTKEIINVTIGIEANIGVGKSSLAEIMSEQLGTRWVPEPVDDNPYLEKYYAYPEKYAFIMQMYLLGVRFRNMKKAMLSHNSIEDRTLEGDKLFAKVNYLQGTMTRDELEVYNAVSDNMLEEIEGMPRKAYDLIIFLDTDIDDMLNKIKLRGREFELSDSLVSYYKLLMEQYIVWANNYTRGPIIKINVKGKDFVNNPDDRKYVLTTVYNKMRELELLTSEQYANVMSLV